MVHPSQRNPLYSSPLASLVPPAANTWLRLSAVRSTDTKIMVVLVKVFRNGPYVRNLRQ